MHGVTFYCYINKYVTIVANFIQQYKYIVSS